METVNCYLLFVTLGSEWRCPVPVTSMCPLYAPWIRFYFCPYRTWLDLLHDVRRALPWAMGDIGLSARCCLLGMCSVNS